MLSSTLDIFAGAEIDLERFAFGIGKIGKPTIEHRLGGRDELHYHGVALGERAVDRWKQARQLHREQQLREEALLGSFEHRKRSCLGPRVQRVAAVGIDNPGFFEGIAQVGMDDGLSRGSGNAEERGVVLQSCGTFRHVLHIIL